MSFRIKKGDIVRVITGEDKHIETKEGKVIRSGEGKVLKVDPKKKRIIIEKINIVSRHRPAQQRANRPGGIIHQEAPISISNVMLMCPKCSKPTRIGARITESGDKERICVKCKAAV